MWVINNLNLIILTNYNRGISTAKAKLIAMSIAKSIFLLYIIRRF